MPTAQAKRLAPQAVYLPVDMPAYQNAQKELLGIFERFTEQVEPVSIDEAYLDVTGSARFFGEPQGLLPCRGRRAPLRSLLRSPAAAVVPGTPTSRRLRPAAP
jgi:DNA polymerase-4